MDEVWVLVVLLFCGWCDLNDLVFGVVDLGGFAGFGDLLCLWVCCFVDLAEWFSISRFFWCFGYCW